VKVHFSTAPSQPGAAESTGHLPPLALVHLAGAVRAEGHDVEIHDPLSRGEGIEAALRRVVASRPDVLCVTALTPSFPDAVDLCQAAQARGVVTVVGGIHASFMYPEFLPHGGIDFVVVGEGEETLPELLACLEADEDPSRVAGLAFPLGSRIVRTARRPRLAVLDPTPTAWDALDWGPYTWSSRPGSRLGAVATSRGCPHPCRACPESVHWECTWRPRSPDAVVWEISRLRRDHGVDVVAFADAAPTWDAARWQALVESLVDQDLGLEVVLWTRAEDVVRDAASLGRWRRAGVAHVGLCRDPEEEWAAEAGAASAGAGGRAIALLRAQGISSEATFWLGFPDETPERIRLLQARARQWDPDVAHFRVVTPLPYTPAWRHLGPLVFTRDYRRFNLLEPVLKPRNMGAEQVHAAVAECYRDFYLGRARRQGGVAPASKSGPGLWEVLAGAASLRDEVLAGATDDERRHLGPRLAPT
jgi:anaerobic magnesium-protoporphyrin IX monomethyl ester cyclase